MTASIQTFQKARQGNYKNLTASVDLSVYETSLKVAEMCGYETVSSFVRDCILEKIESTASSMSLMASQKRDKKVEKARIKALVNADW